MTKGNETGQSDWDERKEGGMTVGQWKAPRNGISGGVQMKRATGSRGSPLKDLKGGEAGAGDAWGRKEEQRGVGAWGYLKAAPSGVVLFKLCQEQVDQKRESMSLCVLSAWP